MGTKLLGISIGRGLGALKGLRAVNSACPATLLIEAIYTLPTTDKSNVYLRALVPACHGALLNRGTHCCAAYFPAGAGPKLPSVAGGAARAASQHARVGGGGPLRAGLAVTAPGRHVPPSLHFHTPRLSLRSSEQGHCAQLRAVPGRVPMMCFFVVVVVLSPFFLVFFFS